MDDIAKVADNIIDAIAGKKCSFVSLQAMDESRTIVEDIISKALTEREAQAVQRERTAVEVALGKYWEDYKIKTFLDLSPKSIDIECAWLGTVSFEGHTLAECIGKAIDAAVDRGAKEEREAAKGLVAQAQNTILMMQKYMSPRIMEGMSPSQLEARLEQCVKEEQEVRETLAALATYNDNRKG